MVLGGQMREFVDAHQKMAVAPKSNQYFLHRWSLDDEVGVGDQGKQGPDAEATTLYVGE